MTTGAPRGTISVHGLGHRFGDRTILSDIKFDVAPSEILAIMGTSGGGKTTLLRCMAGLIVPTEGDVLIEGVSVRSEPEAVRSRLGFVFQSAALFDYLNVQENVLFGVRRQKRLSVQAAKETADRLLERVGLKDAGHLMPSELSGGMRKRVGLARALATEPAIVLYDEPTSGLDPVTGYAIDEMIAQTARDLNVTSLVVSHDVTSVFRVADRIAFLSQGKLAFLGTPEEFEAARDEAIRDLVFKAETRSFL